MNNNLILLWPYLIYFLALLVGALVGVFLSLLSKKGKIRRRVRDRLMVSITLVVWLFLTAIFWVIDHDIPILRNGS